MKKYFLDLVSSFQDQEKMSMDIKLYYVLKGSCTVKGVEESYCLAPGDFILINANRNYQAYSNEDGLFCVFTIAYALLCKDLQADFLYFRCNSVEEEGEKYELLREKIQRILTEHVVQDARRYYKKQELFCSMMNVLIDRFQIPTASSDRRQREADRRLSVIVNYIQVNYDQPITLSDLSEKLFLSPSALSRFFTKATGESFVQYLRRYRLNKVACELAETDKSITRLAVENGFSNGSVMSTEFKNFYGKSPKDYRTLMQAERTKNRQKAEQAERVNERIRDIIKKENLAAGKTNEVRSRVDIHKSLPYRPWKNRVMDVGEISLLERADIQEHVLIYRKKLGIEYVRVWALMSKDLMTIDLKNKSYNWRKMDLILDFCVQNGIKMFLDLGQRTRKAMASENKIIFCSEEGYEFSSKEEWKQYLSEFMRHIVKRYGKEIVQDWIFELSFFLNARPYYEKGYTVKQVWEEGWKIIKGCVPEAKVGGPGLMVVDDKEKMQAIITDFLDTACVPDLFTAFHFPYELTETPNRYRKKIAEDFLKSQIQMNRAILKQAGYQGTYYVTEWNYSIANRSFLQDSCFRAAYTVRNILENNEDAEGLTLWYASDLLNVYTDSDGILSGSAGMLTQDGIFKPIFYAVQFLGKLGNQLIKKDRNFIVTKNSEGDIQILCFNEKRLNYHYFQAEEDSYAPQEVSGLFQNRDILTIDMMLEHLMSGKEYVVRQHIVNEEHGSILDQWIRLGCEKELSAEEVRYLKQTIVPERIKERVRCENGKLNLKFEMLPNEIRVIFVECDA